MNTSEKIKKRKILVLRPDKIGDVVLSTPVLEVLKTADPANEVHLLVRENVFPVVEHNSFVSKFILYKPETEHRGVRGFFRLIRQIRAEKYESAVTLQVQAFVSFAVLLAGIRTRFGPLSKWYSFLIFNRGMRQRRSLVEMHEADYNLILLRKLGIRVPSRKYETKITVDADAKDRMRKFLREHGIEKDFVIVHPGMGGSALNWAEGYYSDLVHQLMKSDVPVVVTGGVSEKELTERVGLRKTENQVSKAIVFVGANSPSGLADLIALISLSKVVVAPSTGPLHIAVALGKRTVSLFSPIKVQSALRWGPYVSDENEKNHAVLVPDALCGQDFKCAGSKCHYYFCMDRLSVEEVYKTVLEKI